MSDRSKTARRRWLAGLALLAWLAAACVPRGVRLPQSDLLGSLERKSGRIAFLGSDGNLYTMDQGGGARAQVTNDAFSDESGYRQYGTPIWSPDGQSLAFSGFTGQADQAPDAASLYTARRDGSNVVEAYTSSEYMFFYDWSPDGDRVGLISQTPTRSLALHLVPAAGGEAELVDAGTPYYWSWAPDGSAVLAHAGGTTSAEARLALVQVRPEVAEYGLDIEPTAFKAPAFSPDGSRVLVAGENATGQPALLMTDALGNNPRTLAEYSGSIAFAWSPDGKRVAYVEAPEEAVGTPGRLVVVDPAGKKSALILPDEDVYAFFWSPDSQRIAYFVREPFEGEGKGEPTPTPEGGEASLVWVLKVLDASSGKSHQLATMALTERFLQIIAYFDQFHQALNIWSPDSHYLVVSAYRPDGNAGIWVVEASGRLEPRYLTQGQVAAWSPR